VVQARLLKIKREAGLVHENGPHPYFLCTGNTVDCLSLADIRIFPDTGAWSWHSVGRNTTGHHMGISFSLIAKAVELAAKVFVTVRDSGTDTSADNSDLVSMIDDVSRKIDLVAGSIGGQVAHQLEKQQLEKLSAQAKVVRLALEIGDAGLLGAAVASISEQIEYSRLRLEEGKQEWFGPWMIAEAVRIEALRIMTTGPRGVAAVERETRNFRINILNHVGRFVITSVDNPWVRIADFVEGRNEELLLGLRDVRALQVSDTATGESTGSRSGPDPVATTAPVPPTDPAPAAKTVIAATKWPFPTSSRP
jgi:hypothetical protein